MTDGINPGDDSDRLLVRWRLRDPLVALACAGAAAPASVADELARGAAVALSVAEDGEPVAGRLDGTVSLVAVPVGHRAAPDHRSRPRPPVADRDARGADAPGRRGRPDRGLRPHRVVRREEG